MTHRWRLPALVLFGMIGLQAPSAATAQAPVARSQFLAGPAQVRDYELWIHVVEQPFQSFSVSLTLVKKDGASLQLHTTSFGVPGSVTAGYSPNMDSTRLDVGFGGLGALHMTFRQNQQSTSTQTPGCPGRGQHPDGVLEGQFSFKFDRSYFKTIAFGSVPTAIWPANPPCRPAGVPRSALAFHTGPVWLGVGESQNPPAMRIGRVGGETVELAETSHQMPFTPYGPGAVLDINHGIVARGPRSALKFQGRNSARVTGVGPWISGQLRLRGGKRQRCRRGGFRGRGRVAGQLGLRFDSMPVRHFRPRTGLLHQHCVT